MTTYTTISLPHHVRPDDVLAVLGVVLGVHHARVPDDGGVADISQPCSVDNRWQVVFAVSPTQDFSCHTIAAYGGFMDERARIAFFDQTGHAHVWSYGVGQAGRNNILTPLDGLFSFLVGRRLVGFFGGTLQVGDERAPYVVPLANAAFQPPSLDPLHDDRRIAFENAVANIPPVALAELTWCIAHCGFFPSPRDTRWIDTIRPGLERQELEMAVSERLAEPKPKMM